MIHMQMPSEKEQMGRFSVELTLANYRDQILAGAGAMSPDEVRQTTIQGVVDTGAARLVLPEKTVSELGLTAAGKARVRCANNRTATRQTVENVWLELQGRHGVFSAVVEPKPTTALVGAIVLEELDFVVDPVTETLHPRDPDRIVAELE